MPAEITKDPLGIACVFSDGTSARFDLGGLPCPELARDLLAGLAELVHPHGTVDSAGSVGQYAQSVRHMTRHLAAGGFTGGGADLRRAQLAQYWVAASGTREACTRRMLQGFQAAGGTLDARLAELAAGRAYNPQRSHRQLPPYSEAEWDRLASACKAITSESYAAHKKALAAAGRGRHPREHGWSEENLRWLLARTGPLGIVAFGENLGCSDNVVRQRGGVLEASRELFPGLDVVIAYRLLSSMRITADQRAANEDRIRAATDRLLRGDIPPGGRCDIKTLALDEAGVDRTAFYGSRPYAHLREEFERRFHALGQAGEQPDPRDAQITQLKDEITRLNERLVQSVATIIDLTEFRTQALARLAAQHDEILRLRRQVGPPAVIRRLPTRAAETRP
jgi:hypothetical protein